MNKKMKKKVKIKTVPLLVLILSIVIVIFIGFILVKVPIKNIYVNGNVILNDQEILELAEIDNYPSFILTTSNHIRKKMLTSEYVLNVRIKKGFFSVTIDIEEYQPLFIDKDNNLVLSSGKLIANDKNILVPSLVNYVPDNKFSFFVEKMSKIDQDILNKISEIVYEPTEQDKDRFALYMNDGNLVYVTLTKLVNLNYYNSILADISCSRGILNLDSGNHFEIKDNICKE